MSLGHIKYSNILRESFHLVSLRCDGVFNYFALTCRYSKSKIGHIMRRQIVLVLGLPLLTQFFLLEQSTGQSLMLV